MSELEKILKDALRQLNSHYENELTKINEKIDTLVNELNDQKRKSSQKRTKLIENIKENTVFREKICDKNTKVTLCETCVNAKTIILINENKQKRIMYSMNCLLDDSTTNPDIWCNRYEEE